MRVVMTGGGGFIGSHLLARMVGAGIDVTLLGPDAGQSRYVDSLVRAGDVRLITCDARFLDREILRLALEGADTLVLLGHTSPGAGSPAERLLEEFTLNVEPVVRLLRVASGHARHVVFASSVAVYGSPERLPVGEADAPRPLTPDAVAKLACEQAVRVSAATSGGTASILRYSTVYGPGETRERTIARLIGQALSGEAPVLEGDGLDRQDYVHVADVAEATMRAIRLRADGVFNIGTGVATARLEVAQAVVALTGARVIPVTRPAPADGTVGLYCDTTLAREALGFSARRSLADGLTEEVGWLRSQLLCPGVGALAAIA